MCVGNGGNHVVLMCMFVSECPHACAHVHVCAAYMFVNPCSCDCCMCRMYM